jgi:hypothetical protein
MALRIYILQNLPCTLSLQIFCEVSDENLRKEGELLEYLGVVREERHLVRIDKLKYIRSSWEEFLKSVGL